MGALVLQRSHGNLNCLMKNLKGLVGALQYVLQGLRFIDGFPMTMGFPMTVGFSEFHGNFLLRDSTFFMQPITQCCAINCTLLCNLSFSC